MTDDRRRLLARSYAANNRGRVVDGSPAVLPGLVAWGVASDLGADGTAIASWPNRATAGIDPVQGTAGNRPTVKASAINGKKAAQFTAASTHNLQFSGAALSWFRNKRGTTFAAVVQPASLTTGAVLFASTGASATTARAMLQARPNATWRGQGRGLDADTGIILDSAVGSLAAGTPAIIVVVMNIATGTDVVYVNGAVSQSAISGSVTAGTTSDTDSLAVALGVTGTTTLPYDGYLAEYAMWAAPFSRGLLDPVLRSWSKQYAIPLAG